MGGRRLPWWAVGISLVATSFSSISLIGGTGFGFNHGMGWLQLQIGDFVAVAVVAAVFLPFFSGLGITTAYEYLGRRFGGTARTVASALFLVQTVLRSSLLILAPAVALSAMLAGFERFPQLLKNLPVRHKPDLDSLPRVVEASREVERELGSEGRLVLRYSGTEPLVRIMIEGPTREEIEALADQLAAVLEAEIG